MAVTSGRRPFRKKGRSQVSESDMRAVHDAGEAASSARQSHYEGNLHGMGGQAGDAMPPAPSTQQPAGEPMPPDRDTT